MGVANLATVSAAWVVIVTGTLALLLFWFVSIAGLLTVAVLV